MTVQHYLTAYPAVYGQFPQAIPQQMAAVPAQREGKQLVSSFRNLSKYFILFINSQKNAVTRCFAQMVYLLMQKCIDKYLGNLNCLEK